MSKLNERSEPPYLKGLYLREDFSFDKIGSAFAPPPQSTQSPQSTIAETSLMDDDEFLKSLLTPLENQDENEPGVEQGDPDDDARSRSNLADDQTASETTELPRKSRYPFSLDWLSPGFQLDFDHPVTFFVGENGSGKSTLLEAIAALCGFPVSGGGSNDVSTRFGPEKESELARALYPHFQKRHRDGYFFRAEFYAHFASLLEERSLDPDFAGDPFQRYGGKSLHARSHGESFLALLQNRFDSGVYCNG